MPIFEPPLPLLWLKTARLPGSEGPVRGDLPGQSKLVAPASVVSVLPVLLGQRLRPGSHTRVQRFLVLGSLNNIVLISPGLFTGSVVSAEIQSQAVRPETIKIKLKR